MKLEDIKTMIDYYFDNISEQELFNLLTEKYHMPIVYDIDLSAFNSETSDNLSIGSTEIQYESSTTEYYDENNAKLESTSIGDFVMNTSDTCVSYSLSLAA